jgi:chromosome partitioning protein
MSSRPASPRIVALLNQKGGVGKTTTTVNLGAALAVSGLRTLLVDMDPQSNLSLHFGVETDEGRPSTGSLFSQPPAKIEDCIVKGRDNLSFIPADTELALVEGELAGRDGVQTVLRDALAKVSKKFDVILLDCPPGLGVLSVNALTAAHEVFVPMQAQYLALRGLEKLLSTVQLVAAGLNPGLMASGVILCMHETLSSHGKAVVDEIRAHLEQFRGADVPWRDCRLLSPPIRRNIKLAEAPSFGKTIFDYDPKCPGAEDYRRLAESVLAMWRERDAAGAANAQAPVAKA